MTFDFASDSARMAAANHASCELGGEAVVLNLDTGVYYGMDSVATCIWRLLHQPRSLAELRDLVTDEFDVASDRCEADLVEFVASLSSHGLVRPCDVANR
jgi:hypothetical protein